MEVMIKKVEGGYFSSNAGSLSFCKDTRII
jgi:hypothetical protein